MRRSMRVSWILMPGILPLPEGMGRARRWKSGVDVDIEGLGFEVSETVSNAGQGLTDGFQVVQGFVRPKSRRLLQRTSKRKKVENFSYMRSTAFLAHARST